MAAGDFVLAVLLCYVFWSQDLDARRVKQAQFYPNKTLFEVADFFTKGCKAFLIMCPRIYKQQRVCARSHSGVFRDFNNYCEMEYENCNTWKNYHIYKREKC